MDCKNILQDVFTFAKYILHRNTFLIRMLEKHLFFALFTLPLYLQKLNSKNGNM